MSAFSNLILKFPEVTIYVVTNLLPAYFSHTQFCYIANLADRITFTIKETFCSTIQDISKTFYLFSFTLNFWIMLIFNKQFRKKIFVKKH